MKGILALLIILLMILVILHAIGSWISPIRESRFYYTLDGILSHILKPIRSVVKPVNGLDFSPLILLVFLYFLKKALGV